MVSVLDGLKCWVHDSHETQNNGLISTSVRPKIKRVERVRQKCIERRRERERITKDGQDRDTSDQ